MDLKKNILFILAALVLGQSSLLALSPGDSVNTDAITKADLLKGSAPTSWEPGKVYILECWATWCLPCILNIPHMDALYDKYREKGLRVIGMNVMEEGKDRAQKFVDGSGDKMSYPVAYVGRDGLFERQWLIPAGVHGIPYAFIVKDGKLLAGMHPAKISEEVIEALLAGGNKQDEILKKILSAGELDEKMGKLTKDFLLAQQANHAEEMIKIVEEIKALDPASTQIASMNMAIAVQQKHWQELETSLSSIQSPEEKRNSSRNLASLLEQETSPDAAQLISLIATSLASTSAEASSKPQDDIISARLLWNIGQKDAASKTMQDLIAKGKWPAAPLEAYQKSLNDNQPESISDLYKEVIATMSKGKQ